MSRAYCGGTFDLFHPGHVRFLEWVKVHFDCVVVALNSDEFANRYKMKPTQSYSERLEMLQSCRWVDEVIMNVGDEDSRPSILASKATHIVNGSDWSSREALMRQMRLTEDFLVGHGLSIVICPLPRIFSTTELKA